VVVSITFFIAMGRTPKGSAADRTTEKV